MKVFLVLCDCLSKGQYNKIPPRMIRYNQSTIDKFILNLDKKSVNIAKLGGFPREKYIVNNCRLTREEAKIVHQAISNSSDWVRIKLSDIAYFYKLNKIIYNKFKHGLLFTPGLSFKLKLEGMPQSVFMAFDLMPRKPEIICFQGKDISPPGLDWFNTYSMLAYEEKSVKKCLEIVDDIVVLSEYILQNHLLWALNCGQDYLPASLTPEGEFKINMILNKSLSEKETENMLNIFNKISPNMQVKTLNINLNFNFSPEKIKVLRTCFLNNQVATITKL